MTESLTTTKLLVLLEEMERSQGWLAKQLRVSRQTMNRWLRGLEACPRSRQAQIAITLGVKASEFFDEDGLPLREDSLGN